MYEAAKAKLEAGDPATAIRIAEALAAQGGDDPGAAAILLEAHEQLLIDGDESFWESGWLRHQIAELRRAEG